MSLYKEQKEAVKKGLWGWHESCLYVFQMTSSCTDNTQINLGAKCVLQKQSVNRNTAGS